MTPPPRMGGESSLRELEQTPSHPAAMVDLTGRVLGERYALVDVVGGGGMGTVYRAVDGHTGAQVAVKVLDPRLDSTHDVAHRERFLRESRLSTSLTHPNIVTVLDTGTSEGIHYIVMELLAGQSLAELLEKERVLPWERAVELIRQVAEGVGHAHAEGLVHRDLKPANCFVTPTGAGELLKVLDFGLAKPVMAAQGTDESNVTRTRVAMGSPLYMAPEQARGEATVQSDIYSLGVMLFRMLAGQTPFDGKTAIDVIVNHIQTPVPWLREVRHDTTVPVEVELVMRRCLEKEARARFASVDGFLIALEEAVEDARGDPSRRHATPHRSISRVASGASQLSPVPALAAPVTAPPPRPRRSRLVPVLLLLLLLLGGGVAAAALGGAFSSPGAPPVAAVAALPVTPEPARVPAEPALKPMVSFRIGSVPEGARVRVEGKVVGVTPAAFELPAGAGGETMAEVTLELRGYETVTFIAESWGQRFNLTQRLVKGTGRTVLPRQVASVVRPAAEPAQEERVGSSEAAPAAPLADSEPAPEAAPLPEPLKTEVVPFGPGMTRPQFDKAILTYNIYTREALEAQVQGVLIIKCNVMADGTVRRCRLLRPLPHLGDAVIGRLQSMKITPATFQGTPVSIDYVFNFNFTLPR